jgi:hypothetical protein
MRQVLLVIAILFVVGWVLVHMPKRALIVARSAAAANVGSDVPIDAEVSLAAFSTGRRAWQYGTPHPLVLAALQVMISMMALIAYERDAAGVSSVRHGAQRRLAPHAHSGKPATIA